jgi:phosphotransferase system IIA component
MSGLLVVAEEAFEAAVALAVATTEAAGTATKVTAAAAEGAMMAGEVGRGVALTSNKNRCGLAPAASVTTKTAQHALRVKTRSLMELLPHRGTSLNVGTSRRAS